MMRDLGYASQRAVHIITAVDGSIVEVFDGISSDAIEKDRKNPGVLEMWKKIRASCENVSLGYFEESISPFSGF